MISKDLPVAFFIEGSAKHNQWGSRNQKGNASRLSSRYVTIVLFESDIDALSIEVWLDDAKESATFVSAAFGRTNLRVAGAAERYIW